MASAMTGFGLRRSFVPRAFVAVRPLQGRNHYAGGQLIGIRNAARTGQRRKSPPRASGCPATLTKNPPGTGGQHEEGATLVIAYMKQWFAAHDPN